MHDVPIEALSGRHPDVFRFGPIGALLLLLAMLGMLVVAYAIVSLERKIKRGDFDPTPPQMRRRPWPQARGGFPVILSEETP